MIVSRIGDVEQMMDCENKRMEALTVRSMPLRTTGNQECAPRTSGARISELLTAHSKLLEGQIDIARREGRGRKRRRAEDRPQFLQNESTED
jgi:hypothetical protein